MVKKDKPPMDKKGSVHRKKADSGSVHTYRDSTTGHYVTNAGGKDAGKDLKKDPESPPVIPAESGSRRELRGTSGGKSTAYAIPQASGQLQGISAGRSAAVARLVVVPLDFMGKWVAWSSDGLRIVAAGETLHEVEAAVERAGLGPVAIEKLRPATSRVDSEAEG